MSLIDYTSKDYESLRTSLLQLATEKLPDWTDQSPNDLGVMLLELVAAMGDSLFYNQDRIAGESFLETAVERRSLVQLLRLIGYELKPALAASADLTLLFKIPTAPTGPAIPVTINQFSAFTTTAKVTGVPIAFQYVQPTPIAIPDLRALPYGVVNAKGELSVKPLGQPLPPPVTGSTGYLVYRSIPVVQVDANVTNEIVASSDGSAMQRYALKRAPVVDSTLVLTVTGERWKLVNSLLGSHNSDQHYTVRRDENGTVYVEFGDGTNGMIPSRGVNNITATYCIGGGTKGNVPIGAISKVVTSIDQLKLVYNEQQTGGGTDPEPTASAVQRGPALFRTMGRAVTAADYEELAMSFGVSKAHATSTSWNNIQLMVAPEGGGTASQTLREDLLAFLESKRIMTSIVKIVDPTYVQVFLEASVTVLPQFSKSVVQQLVQNAVQQLFAFDNVDFGQTIYLSKIYEIIQELAGVQGALITKLARKDTYDATSPATWMPGTGFFTFAHNEIPTWSGFTPDHPLVMQGGVSNG